MWLDGASIACTSATVLSHGTHSKSTTAPAIAVTGKRARTTASSMYGCGCDCVQTCAARVTVCRCDSSTRTPPYHSRHQQPRPRPSSSSCLVALPRDNHQGRTLSPSSLPTPPAPSHTRAMEVTSILSQPNRVHTTCRPWHTLVHVSRSQNRMLLRRLHDASCWCVPLVRNRR